MIPIIRKPTVLITIPRRTEPPTRGLAHPPAPPPPVPGPSTQHPAPGPSLRPGTRHVPPATTAAKVTPHSISQGLRLLPMPLPFLFCPVFFVCFSLVEPMLQQQFVGNVLCSQHHDAHQIKAWMFAAVELDWKLSD